LRKEVSNFQLSSKGETLIIDRGDFDYEVLFFEGIDRDAQPEWPDESSWAVHYPPGTFTIRMLEGPLKDKDLEFCWDGIYLTCLTGGWRIQMGIDDVPRMLEDVSGGRH
jgi:hypothetical protein